MLFVSSCGRKVNGRLTLTTVSTSSSTSFSALASLLASGSSSASLDWILEAEAVYAPSLAFRLLWALGAVFDLVALPYSSV